MPGVGAVRQKKWAAKTSTGCVTCRKRRVKCDEAKPTCQRCEKYGAKCGGYVDHAAPRNVFSSARELYRLRTLPDGAIVGMIDAVDLDTSKQASASESDDACDSELNKSSESARYEDGGPKTRELALTNPSNLSLVSTCRRSFDAVDPTRSSALSKVPEAAQLLGFWQRWTLQSPSAPKCFTACLYDEASFTALMSVVSLMMQHSKVDSHSRRTTAAISLRSIKALRQRLSEDDMFFLTEPGLNAFSWQVMYAWLAGDTSIGRMHLMALSRALHCKDMSPWDLPDYIQEILAYCDFVSSLFTLQRMVFGIPESLIMDVPRGSSTDPLLEADAVKLLACLETFEPHTLHFDAVRKAFKMMLTATRLFYLLASGELPCSVFRQASYTFFKATSLVLPFAFYSEPLPVDHTPTPQPSKQNTTAYLGVLLLLWGYVLVAPLGVVNSGGMLAFSSDTQARLPSSHVPKVAYAFEQLNNIGYEAWAAVSSGTGKGPTATKVSATIINTLDEVAGSDFAVLTVIAKRYIQTMLTSRVVSEVLEYRNPDLSPRLRMFGTFVGRWNFVGAL